jgi:hypothetical protein
VTIEQTDIRIGLGSDYVRFNYAGENNTNQEIFAPPPMVKIWCILFL